MAAAQALVRTMRETLIVFRAHRELFARTIDSLRNGSL